MHGPNPAIVRARAIAANGSVGAAADAGRRTDPRRPKMSHHAHGTVAQSTAADTHHDRAPRPHVGHGHPAGHGDQGDQGHEVRRSWTTLAVMLMAQFMVILDVSVVNVAL